MAITVTKNPNPTAILFMALLQGLTDNGIISPCQDLGHSNSTRVRGPIAALLLHFVEVAPVGIERVVGFFVETRVVGHLY